MSNEKKPVIFVATPMFGGVCNGMYTLGLIHAVHVLVQNQIGFQYSMIQNESLITRARNTLAHDFLDTDATHMMFIDADIGFDAEYIVKMLDADKDIICGIYPKKEINWNQVSIAVQKGVSPEDLKYCTGEFVINLVNDAAEAEGLVNEPFEISNGGTGFMLIKREVFEKLSNMVPEYNNDMFVSTDNDRKPVVIKEFFATSIDKNSGNRLLSEDYHFCKIAREAGFKIWGAPWAQLVHCGTYNFSGILPRI